MNHFLENIWENILGVNSLIIWPISLVLLIYSFGHALITLQWKLFVIAAIFFAIDTIAQVVIGIICD